MSQAVDGGIAGKDPEISGAVGRSAPNARSCGDSADAKTPERSALPTLAGELATDMRARLDVAGDAGHMVHRLPRAVLRPRSAEDIARVVGYCRQRGMQIAARGQGHTMLGQSQVKDGTIIDMSSLGAIHFVERDRAVVGAGATWDSVLAAT